MFSISKHREGAHQLGCTIESLGDPADLGDEIARPVRVGVVISVARVEDGVEKLVLGFEVVKQTGGLTPASLAICANEVLRHPLRATSRSATSRIRALRSSPLASNAAYGLGDCSRADTEPPRSNQPSEHTVGRFGRCDKGLGGIRSAHRRTAEPLPRRGRRTNLVTYWTLATYAHNLSGVAGRPDADPQRNESLLDHGTYASVRGPSSRFHSYRHRASPTGAARREDEGH